MIIDAHCDVLSKLYQEPDLDFLDSPKLDVTLDRLRTSETLLQCFAIYIPQSVLKPSIEHVLRYIHLFHHRILHYSDMHFVRTALDLQAIQPGRKIGAMLTLEGVDALEGNPDYVQLLHELGVRCLGLTWNYANWAADGVLEPRRGGLTLKGLELVDACAQSGMIVDVSHLAEPGFWQLLERSDSPIIASHSNAYSLCAHPRNLKDDQILAIIQAEGRIGLTFVPYFVQSSGTASLTDMLKHIDHICSLGGERHLMIGSDFDGIDEWIPGLEHPGKLEYFTNILYNHFPQRTVEGLLWQNAMSFFRQTLPPS